MHKSEIRNLDFCGIFSPSYSSPFPVPDGDKKAAGGAKSQNTAEKPGMESVSENYFKAVNDEFEKIVIEKPEQMVNEKLIDEIAKRNEKSFEHKVVDALKNPGEALKWGGNMLKTYAASWLSEIFGLKKYMSGLKDKVKEKFGKAKDWVSDKKKGVEQRLDELKKDVEHDGDYEMEDFEKALPEYYKDFKEILIPVKQFAGRNALLLSVLGTILTVKHFDRIKNAAEGSKDFLLGLAKMPWPKKLLFMGSLCGTMAVLMYLYKTEELGKIKVPKDSRNFKKWLLTKVQHEEKQIAAFLEAEGVPNLLSGLTSHIDILDQLAQGKKHIKEFIAHPQDAVSHLLEGAKEFVRQNPEKFIRDQNIKGLSSFIKDLDLVALRAPSEVVGKCLHVQGSIRAIIAELKNGNPFTKKQTDTLKDEIEGLGVGFELLLHEGYLVVRRPLDPHFSRILIGIDPSLPPDQQFEKAWGFWPEEGWSAGVQKAADLLLEQLRFALDTGFEAFEYQENAPNLLERILRGGAYLVGAFGKVALTKGVKEYYLGPWELVWDMLRPMVEKKEFSAVEFATNWEGMILPVFCFGVTKHIAVNVMRGKIKEGFLGIKPKNILAESTVYPLLWSGRRIVDVFQMSAAVSKGQLGEFLKNKVYTLHDEFFEFMARVQYRRSWIPFFPLGKAIAQERWIQANLYEALGYLRQATNNPLRSEPAQDLIDKARKALKGAGRTAENIAFADKNMKEAKEAILKIEEKIHALDDKVMLMGRTGEKFLEPLQGPPNEAPKPAREEAPDSAKAGAEGERLKKIELEAKDLQAQLANLQRELEQRKKYIVDTATAQKKSITDPEIVQQLRALEQSLGPKISAAEESFMRFFHGHPELGRQPLPKVGHPSVPEVPTKVPRDPEIKPRIPSKVKRIGLHFLGLGVGIGLSAALGVGLSKGLEALAEKEDEFSIQPVYARTRGNGEDPQRKEAESMRFLDDYAKSFNAEYSVLYDRLSYDKLQQYDKEDSLPLVVANMASAHLKIVEKMKAFFAIPGNQQLLFRFYEQLAGQTFADLKKPKKITEYFALSFDTSTKELLFHYANEDDFKDQMYDFADFVMRHDGRTEARQSDLAKDALKYATPGLGIYMDARDMRNATRRGQVGRAIKSGIWTGVGAVADVAMLTGVGALLTATVRGTALAAKSARAAKIAMGVGLAGGALDVAYQVFAPKHSEVMRISRPPQTFVSDDFKPEVLPGDIAGNRK